MKHPALGWLAVSTLSITLAACGTSQLPSTSQASSGTQAPPAVQAGSAATMANQSLDQMAKYLAQAITDPSLRQQIRDQAAKRFDGDTNVLYSTLAASSDVRSKLATAYNQGFHVQSVAALSAIDKLSSSVTRLQVAVPARFEAWDAAQYTPLVGFAPVGADDMALKTITAYDAQGQAHTLDAQVAPTVPVIILSQNERTDDQGNVLQAFKAPGLAEQAVSAQGTYQVKLVAATLVEDKEPWILGDAEVMLIAKGSGLYYHGGVVDLNNSGDHLEINRLLGTTTGDMNFYWYEKDGDNVDFNVGVEGISLGVKIDSSDDFLGAIRMGNGYFQGTTTNKRDLGSIVQWTN